MSVLVTGATGFLGGAVVERLLARGTDHVRCLARPTSNRGRLEALRARYPATNLEIVTGGLASVEDARRAIGEAKEIYHLAAGMRGAPADLFLNTVVTSRNLLDAAVAAPVRKIILASSFAVYGVANLPVDARITETTPLEAHPERRDPYSHAKHRQEELFWSYHRSHDLPLVVLRPGVLYGPGGPALSSRIGLRLPGLYLHLGGNNPLPLSFVDNCAEAIVLAGLARGNNGAVYNVHDDDLPTCAEFLHRYKREVEPLRSIRIPYTALSMLALLSEKYHAHSHGQMPAVLTSYRTASTWKRTRFDNHKLKQLGWQPLVQTNEGLRRTFEELRSQHVHAAAVRAE